MKIKDISSTVEILWALRGIVARIEKSSYDVYEAFDIKNDLIQLINEIK